MSAKAAASHWVHSTRPGKARRVGYHSSQETGICKIGKVMQSIQRHKVEDYFLYPFLGKNSETQHKDTEQNQYEMNKEGGDG